MTVIDFQKPDKVIMQQLSEREATFELAPLEPGYGVTVGNSLRRVLLSALEGYAITSFVLQGVDHEFRAVKGVLEDMSEIVLNLKQIRFKLIDPTLDITQEKVQISFKGKEKFKAGDLMKSLTNFEILNPELVICNIDPVETDPLNWVFFIEKGRGYVPSEQNQVANVPIGTIFIDAIYTPILNVKYDVTNFRVGQKTDYEKLLLTIITDGSIAPKEALENAATILMSHLQLFSNEHITMDSFYGPEINLDENSIQIRQLLKTKLASMNLSVRAVNCLKAAEVETMADLVSFHKTDLLRFRNFGKKSLTELEQLVHSKGLQFGMDISKYMLDKE